MRHISKPQPDEYQAYASIYIDLLPDDGAVLQHLNDNMQVMTDLLAQFSEEQLVTPHTAGEWTIKEILLHVIDDERIYAYRALRTARDDKTELPGFEQDDYIVPSRANERSIDSLLDEYRAVRQATITLFKYLPADAFTRRTLANGFTTSVRALAYHIAGHELHHIESIREHYL